MDTFDCKGKSNNCNGVSIIVPAYNRGANGLSKTERIAKEILSLPLYPELNESDVIVEAVKEFEKKVG